MSHSPDPAVPEDPHGPTPPGPVAGRLTRRRVVVLVGALLALLLLVWALAQRGDDPAPAAAPTASASPTVEPSASPDPEETPSSSPSPTAEPGAEPTTAPGDPAVPAQPALPEPLAPRALTEEAEIGPEAVARVSRLEAVEGEPQGVGEIAGPALRLTIEVQNTGTAPIPIQDAVVNVTHGAEATPATEVSGPGRQPFTGEIAPGQSATGTYVFVVPTDDREIVSVSLEYRAGAPVAVFRGSAAAAPAG